MSNMINNNSTDNILSSNTLLLPNVILDAIGIGLSIIGICKTFIFILLILIHHLLTKSKEKILFLLSLNMYMSVFIFALFVLDMFISMIEGHTNPNSSHLDYDTERCRLKIYLSTIALISALYSNVLQGLHRFFRIVYYTRPFFHRNICLYIFGIIIQVFLSALIQLPILLTGQYQYEDYHCQVYLTNWRGILMGALLVWLLPVSLTIIIYAYTMHYVRRHLSKFTAQRKARISRDVIVIKRVLWLVIFILIFGTPACSTTIVYQIFGYVGWWANHLTWLTFISSFTGMSIVHTCYSPHLRVLWSTASNHIGQQRR
jgi:hypothetical protein